MKKHLIILSTFIFIVALFSICSFADSESNSYYLGYSSPYAWFSNTEDFTVTATGSGSSEHTIIYANSNSNSGDFSFEPYVSTVFGLDKLVSFTLSVPETDYVNSGSLTNFPELELFLNINDCRYYLFDIQGIARFVRVNGNNVTSSTGNTLNFLSRDERSIQSLDVSYYIDTVNSKIFLSLSSSKGAYTRVIDIDLNSYDENIASNDYYLIMNIPHNANADLDDLGSYNAENAWQIDIGHPTLVDTQHMPLFNLFCVNTPDQNGSYDDGYSDGYDKGVADRNTFYSGYISPSELNSKYYSKTYVSSNYTSNATVQSQFTQNSIVQSDYYTKSHVNSYYTLNEIVTRDYILRSSVDKDYTANTIVERDYMLKASGQELINQGYQNCLNDYAQANTAVVETVGGIFDATVNAFRSVTEGVTLFGFSLQTVFVTIVALAVIAIIAKLFILK